MKILWTMVLIILIVGIAMVSRYYPALLSDENGFLLEFVNHQLLAFLGVIVTITLASSANLHLELNRLESRTGESFPEARKAIRKYAFLLIFLLAVSVVLVVAKPLIAHSLIVQSWVNGTALVITVLNIMALADLTGAVFAIPADTPAN